jgi:anti-sigma B factor antagonist
VSLLNSQFKGENEDVLVVSFESARILDDATIQRIGQDLLTLAGEAREGRMVLNFGAVKFMSSAMIGKIILLHKKCKADNITLKLCSISNEVMEVFKLMRLNKLLEIHDEESKAVASFDKKSWFS